jgi:ABC-2 type transport system ATP-binding protein
VIVNIENLTMRYGRRRILSVAALDIPEGAIVGLVGPNGAGKTTLLEIVVGLRRPTAGTVRVLDRAPAAAMRTGRVAFVAQNAPTYPHLTVADHLRLGAALNPGRFDTRAATARLDRLGVEPRRRAGRLSGGQRAQLALTLALAKQPDLLVLDEPVASLDPLARRDFLAEAAAAGTTAVVSTHLLADVEQVCDHLVVLVAGEVRLAGPVPGNLAEVVYTHLGGAA